MSKIIIHNESDLPDTLAVECVKRVMDMGFVSGEKQYCWVSTFSTILHNNLMVLARNTRGETHSFSVRNSE